MSLGVSGPPQPTSLSHPKFTANTIERNAPMMKLGTLAPIVAKETPT